MHEFVEILSHCSYRNSCTVYVYSVCDMHVKPSARGLRYFERVERIGQCPRRALFVQKRTTANTPRFPSTEVA